MNTDPHNCLSPLHAPPNSHDFKIFIFPTHVILYMLVGLFYGIMEEETLYTPHFILILKQ